MRKGHEAAAAASTGTRIRTGELARDKAAAESTAAAASKEEVMESTSDPEYHLAVEVLYHGMRQGFLLAAHRWTIFAAVVFGAAAAATIWGESMCALAATAAAAADIAFDFVGRAQVHADLKRRYLEMVGDLARGELGDFATKWMVVSADEPPLLKTLAKVAEWDAAVSLGRVTTDMVKPTFWERRLAHFLE